MTIVTTLYLLYTVAKMFEKACTMDKRLQHSNAFQPYYLTILTNFISKVFYIMAV